MYPDMVGVPDLFFSTAAGPDVSDIIGPPQGVLDVYADGSPISQAESTISQSGGGGAFNWWQRGDVHALIIGAIGVALIHAYTQN